MIGDISSFPAAETTSELVLHASEALTDSCDDVRTVEAVPNHKYHQRRSLLSSLGRLTGLDDGATTPTSEQAELVRLSAMAPKQVYAVQVRFQKVRAR